MALLMTLPNKRESIVMEHIVATTETKIMQVTDDSTPEDEMKTVEIDYFVIHLADGSSRGVQDWKLQDFSNWIASEIRKAQSQIQLVQP